MLAKNGTNADQKMLENMKNVSIVLFTIERYGAGAIAWLGRWGGFAMKALTKIYGW